MDNQNQYTTLKARHREELDAVPLQWAFSSEQFSKGMAALGLDPDDTDKIISIGGGGFMLASDERRLDEMMERHHREHSAAIAGDATGEGYIYDAVYYELGNHEYGYSGDDTEALRALCITRKQATDDSRIAWALSCAKRAHMDWYRMHG